MERHDQMERGKTPNTSFSSPMVEEYQPINATYNLPKDLLEEQPVMSRPTQNNYNNTADKIANSKLPDEIKKLMLEINEISKKRNQKIFFLIFPQKYDLALTQKNYKKFFMTLNNKLKIIDFTKIMKIAIQVQYS